MTTIITITADEIRSIGAITYDYSGNDRILKNILTGEYEVFYSGQNQGRMDYQLTDAVNTFSTFRIYYRRKSSAPFTFLGTTTRSSIVKERITPTGTNSNPDERLQIRLVVPPDNIYGIEIASPFEGAGKYKKAILHHSDFPVEGKINFVIGFYSK